MDPDAPTNTFVGATGSDQLQGLVDLIGFTATVADTRRISAVTGTRCNMRNMRSIQVNDENDPSRDDVVQILTVPQDARNAGIAHVLVRTVPAPGAFALFAGAGLACSRRRGRQRL